MEKSLLEISPDIYDCKNCWDSNMALLGLPRDFREKKFNSYDSPSSSNEGKFELLTQSESNKDPMLSFVCSVSW